MKAKKWDCKTRRYYANDLPKGACLCGDDMDKVIVRRVSIIKRSDRKWLKQIR